MKSDIKDLSGQVIGNWRIISESGRASNNEVMWRCQCSCGTVRDVRGAKIRQGNSNSCGCAVGVDISGQTYGEWVAMFKTRDHKGNLRWLCKHVDNEIYAMFTMSRLKNQAVTYDRNQKGGKWKVICNAGECVSGKGGRWVVGNGLPGGMVIAECVETGMVVAFNGGTEPPNLIQKNSSADDLCGQKFKSWVVVEKEGPNRHGQMMWKCRCSNCGFVNSIVSFAIKRGTGCKNCRKLGINEENVVQAEMEA